MKAFLFLITLGGCVPFNPQTPHSDKGVDQEEREGKILDEDQITCIDSDGRRYHGHKSCLPDLPLTEKGREKEQKPQKKEE